MESRGRGRRLRPLPLVNNGEAIPGGGGEGTEDTENASPPAILCFFRRVVVGHEKLRDERRYGEHRTGEQGLMNAFLPAVPGDEPAANEWPEHHRHAADQGLDADAHRMLLALQPGGDYGESCGRDSELHAEKKNTPTRSAKRLGQM